MDRVIATGCIAIRWTKLYWEHFHFTKSEGAARQAPYSPMIRVETRLSGQDL